MTCPYCEIHKLSAAMWRNKAYELGGTPLPWDADKKIEEAIAAEREACAKVCDAAAKKMDDEGEGPTGYIAWVTDCAAAIRARGNK